MPDQKQPPPDESIVTSTVEARQGFLDRPVLLILSASLFLAAMAAVYLLIG